jgi:hypothetical protein
MNVQFDPFEQWTFWHRGCGVASGTMFPYFHQGPDGITKAETTCTACRHVDVGHLPIGKTCNDLVVNDDMCIEYVSYVLVEV